MPRKIYLVEDEKSLNILLEKYLQREGDEIITFSNGISAVERIKDMPDLWILDIMLPDIDGYEIIKAVKQYNKNTPVIFMSARNEELDRVVGLELGSDDYLSKPLKELEDYTVRIAHKDWKEALHLKSEDEIGRLVNSMNRMQTELKHADEEEKMFLQSISHDLKTPVMVIMSHADAIIDGVYVESVERTAEIIRDEAVNLEKKIKQLLYLNTLDYVLQNNSENEEIKLQDLLQRIIGRFEVINSKIEWDLNLQNIIVNGNLDKIQVSIENVLDNSLRYAKDEIRVTLKKENNFAVLEIYNDGPNIKPQHIGHIFDNLYKDKTGNFGLGLAISKKIVDFYKGEIEAVNRENGVSFIIKYPVYDK